ncbi:unnamed protein product [Ambrosiozyma monospora]|uniref:Unnamed protein product n=1 Tax=Ambrosiozyma monospora TaxID=43982 RepID=A0A9W6Z5E4_AMBMO|nr:unnamed protein product [Ambrosiozyma monospora]
MGNETSKAKGNSQFSRSDTATSIRSGRSIRSKKSLKENDSHTSGHRPPSIRRRSSSLKSSSELVDAMDDLNFENAKEDGYQYDYINEKDNNILPINVNGSDANGNISTNGNGNGNYSSSESNGLNTPGGGHSYSGSNGTSNNLKLPPSMVSLPPKSPILRMNSSSSLPQGTPASSSPRELTRRLSSNQPGTPGPQ